MELLQIGQLSILEWKVDVQQLIGNLWDSQIEIIVKVKHNVNVAAGDHAPIVNVGRDEQQPLLIDWKYLHWRSSKAVLSCG